MMWNNYNAILDCYRLSIHFKVPVQLAALLMVNLLCDALFTKSHLICGTRFFIVEKLAKFFYATYNLNFICQKNWFSYDFKDKIIML